MRILIAIDSLKYGGAERVAVLWAKGFHDRGHEVFFVTHDKDNIISYDIHCQVKIINLWRNEKDRRLRKWMVLIPRLRKIINEFRPDVIINILGFWCLSSWIAAFGKGIKIVSTEHNTFDNPPYKPMRKTVWLRKFWINKFMDYVTVITQFDKDFIGKKIKKVAFIPNPLVYSPLNSIPPKSTIVLAAGRLGSWHYKGFDLLIKAWGEVAHKHPQWELQIAGNGTTEDIEMIMSFARNSNVLESVKLLGFCKDMETVYRKSSVFVLSSRYEGFGMVLTEAMSQGCACIACNYQGRQGEIITSDNQGLLIEPNNASAIAKALEKVISDTHYREVIQKNGIERSRCFELEQIMSLWDGVFRDLKLTS